MRPVSGVVDVVKRWRRSYGCWARAGCTSRARTRGSYMWLAVADPEGVIGIVAGFDTASGAAALFALGSEQVHVARRRPDRLRQAAGEARADRDAGDIRPRLFRRRATGPGRLGPTPSPKSIDIKLPPQPSGYCTWYHARASNEKALVKQTEFAAKDSNLSASPSCKSTTAGRTGVASNGPRKNFTLHSPDGPYPSGMKQTADNDQVPRPHAGHLVHALRRHFQRPVVQGPSGLVRQTGRRPPYDYAGAAPAWT